MRRSLVFALTLLLTSALPLFAGSRLRVVATLQDYAWLAQQVGGDGVEVRFLAKGTQDPHFVDPKPSYLVALHRADVLLSNGLQLEVGWLPPLLAQAGNARIQPGAAGYVELSRFIQPIEVPAGGVDRSMGDVHPFGNPHFHLDPQNMIAAGQGLAEVLAHLDPSRAEVYRENARSLQASLDDLDREIAKVLEPLKGEPIVIYHSSLDYLFNHYGIEVAGFVEPKPGIKPSPSSLMTLEASMRTKGVRLVVCEAYQDLKTARRVAGDTGCKLVVIPSYTGGAPDADTYPDLLRTIARALVEARRG